MASDVVNFLCPKCGQLVEVSSMKDQGVVSKYSAFCAPVDVANRIVGDQVTCEECFETFTVEPDQLKFVVLRLVERK